ncbi:HYR domain-containing protein, partial [Cytobacillus sp.]
RGTTTVICTAIDAAGNTSTCSFHVTIIIDPCRFFSCRRRR